MNSRLYRYHYRIAVSLVLIISFAFGQVGHASASSIIYVKVNAVGANNGTSWANAYKNLQVALAAATPGSQLWVAAGTYLPTNGLTALSALACGPESPSTEGSPATKPSSASASRP